MAYLIECDRCGETCRVAAPTSVTPKQWLQFNDMVLGDGQVDAMKQPIKGGVFCEGCVKDLRKWRQPLPRPVPEYSA